MKVSERVFELWKTYGWNVEPEPTQPQPEAWCQGFEGSVTPEPEIKVERASER